jgi:hypothetical protein
LQELQVDAIQIVIDFLQVIHEVGKAEGDLERGIEIACIS